MQQNERKASRTRSQEEVPVAECLDGFARITSKELATRPRVVVGLGKSAHSHTVRLMNSRQKGPKRMMTKVQWPY